MRVRVRVRAIRFRSVPFRFLADLFYSSHIYLNLSFGENKIGRMADQQEEETRLMDAPVEMELKRIGFVKDAMKTAEPYYEGLKSKSGPLKVRFSASVSQILFWKRTWTPRQRPTGCFL